MNHMNDITLSLQSDLLVCGGLGIILTLVAKQEHLSLSTIYISLLGVSKANARSAKEINIDVFHPRTNLLVHEINMFLSNNIR